LAIPDGVGRGYRRVIGVEMHGQDTASHSGEEKVRARRALDVDIRGEAHGPGVGTMSDMISLGGDEMTEFEVRARLKVREGQLEGFKRQAAEVMRQAREKDKGTLAYDWFLSNDGTQCEVREAYVDADALIEHAFNVREARDALFAEFAEDHRMFVYGDPSPRLIELMDKVGVNVTYFTLLQAFEPVAAR
jgi:quinol monooxygenase YgiN